MPTINSPITNKNYQQNAGMREFVIPDGSDEMDHHQHYPEEHMHQASPMQAPQYPAQQNIPLQSVMQNRKSAEKNNKISDAGRKRIEILCGMSSLTKEVDIEGNIFVLRSLKSKESRDCLVSSLKYDGTIEFTFELRKQILARSIATVSGIDLADFVGSYDFEAKLQFIDELDDLIIDKLYAQYLSLNKQIKDKYGLSDQNVVKEVVEDIKK